MARKPKKTKKTTRKQIVSRLDKIVFPFYRNLQCVICNWKNEPQNCASAGHHIVRVGRCSSHVYDPANIIPLCPSHHIMGNDIKAHGLDTLAIGRFTEFLKTKMPKRWEKAQEAELDGKNGRKLTVFELEELLNLWEAVINNSRDYEFLCETCGVEAYAERE